MINFLVFDWFLIGDEIVKDQQVTALMLPVSLQLFSESLEVGLCNYLL